MLCVVSDSTTKYGVVHPVLSIPTYQLESGYPSVFHIFQRVLSNLGRPFRLTSRRSLSVTVAPVNFGGIVRSVTSPIAMFVGLFQTLEGLFPIVRYTDQAFFSPEKLVRCVPFDAYMIGITVTPSGKPS